MKSYLPLSLAALLSLAVTPLFAADEQSGDGSGQMKIEQVIAACEDQYSEEKYPDADERNKFIDKCIDEKSGTSSEKD